MDGYGYHLTSLSCLTLVPPQLAASHPLLRSKMSPDTTHGVEVENVRPFKFSQIQRLAILFMVSGVSDTILDANVGPPPPLYPSSPFPGSSGRVCTCVAIYGDHRLKIPYLATPIAPPIKMATGGLILNHAPPTYAVPVMATSQGSVPSGLPLCTPAVR